MSNYIYLSGKGFWMHRLFEPDEYKGVKSYSLTLYPDPKSWKVFREVALQQHIKEDEEGKFLRFKKPVKKPWKLKENESPNFDAPTVSTADGNAWPEDKLIGNGSEVTVKIEVYDTKMGRGARIEGVRVDKWVEYKKPEEDINEDPDDEIRPF